MKSLFEKNEGTYSAASDYLIPNLTVPDEPESQIACGDSGGWTT